MTTTLMTEETVADLCDGFVYSEQEQKGGNDMLGMKKKAENEVAQDSKNAMKRPADEISEDVLRQIVGGADDDDERPPRPIRD